LTSENEKDREKVTKLIRLLASDKDGEVLNAVRSIDRLLKKHGKSFNDLAERLNN
jgi:flagellar biosynthesis regulator FlbT